jgi:hypothetical protein
VPRLPGPSKVTIQDAFGLAGHYVVIVSGSRHEGGCGQLSSLRSERT